MTGFLKQELSAFIDGLPVEVLSRSDLPRGWITGITDDSRAVQPGNIFVAVKGAQVDGHHFIGQALSAGAVAVVGTEPSGEYAVPYIQVADAREALGHLAAIFYHHPSRNLTVTGVTGTDGKTTTANLIYQILLQARIPAGIVSTVNAMIGAEVVDTGFHVTTPGAMEIQQYLARMVAAGLTHVVLESTSHGLAQHRVTGCDFDVGVLTNITHEHINDHGSFEAYRDAKAMLFTGLARHAAKDHGVPPLAVLNQEDPSYVYLRERIAVRQVSYAVSPGADVWAEDVRHSADGLHFVAHGPGFSLPISTHLMGAFNVPNCLAAISATVLGLGIDPQDAAQGIANLAGVPGRMEQIVMGQPFIALVDFAHTPNALTQALKAARAMTSGRVISVFGSAGLRDREKRRMMAEVSVQLADISVFTAEDPRTESLDDILAEMVAGAGGQSAVEGKNFLRVPDRGNAIRWAVGLARAGDVVIACGKGHEQSMCFGVVEYPWDDRAAMRAALAELLHATGPRMPYLPTQEEPDADEVTG